MFLANSVNKYLCRVKNEFLSSFDDFISIKPLTSKTKTIVFNEEMLVELI